MLFDYKKTCLVNEKELSNTFQHLMPEIKKMQQERTKLYESSYGFINLPFDVTMHKIIIAVAQQKKKYQPTMLILIGIGGSNLGTMAIIEALFGIFYNDNQQLPMKMYCADTVDNDYINVIYQKAQEELEAGNNILINVVTKSGTTTETIANFELFLGLLQRYCPKNYADYVVVTTDEGSSLESIAKKEHFSLLTIPKYVGGRYSVFSAVGLFSLALLDCDIYQLVQGAQDATQKSIAETIDHNYAALSAVIRYQHYQEKKSIHDMFLFSKQLESLGKWYRQLMGESIGKEFDIHQKRVCVGITPTVSVGTIDLHSVGQLYLGGPFDKFTVFVSIGQSNETLKVPDFALFESCVSSLQGTSLASIMEAIVQGVQRAYFNNKRAFYSLSLPALSAYSIGQFLQIYMIEMVYLGYLLQVNPFDQPNVELYKRETRKILANE